MATPFLPSFLTLFCVLLILLRLSMIKYHLLLLIIKLVYNSIYQIHNGHNQVCSPSLLLCNICLM